MDIPSVAQLKSTLKLDDETGDDIQGLLVGLVTSAVHDPIPLRPLKQVYDAVKCTDGVVYLEPLTLLPVLLPCDNDAAEDFVILISQQSSAKEAVIAAQEVLERLDVNPDADEHPATEDQDLSPLKQLIRIIRVYANALPRMPHRKTTPAETLKPLVSDLSNKISEISQGDISVSERRTLIATISSSVPSIFQWAHSDSVNEQSKLRDVLLEFLTTTLEQLGTSINEGLATKAFEEQFSRLVVHSLDEDNSSQVDVVREIQQAILSVGITPQMSTIRPSLGSLILLAHVPSYTFPLPVLGQFFPSIVVWLQSNMALDATLSLLIKTIVPFRSQHPGVEFPLDMLISLTHVLAPLASIHPDPSTRHHVFRLLSVVLSLVPSPLRLELLHGLLNDMDSAPQMRVASVSLVKEALLEALSTAPGSAVRSRNVFTSPMFLRTLGPALFRPNPPDLFNSGNPVDVEEFLESPEPLRLVECLGLLYILLNRDANNTTGIRDKDNLRNIKKTLLDPLCQQLNSWNEEMNDTTASEEDSLMQLGILDMWVERVSAIVEALYKG